MADSTNSLDSTDVFTIGPISDGDWKALCGAERFASGARPVSFVSGDGRVTGVVDGSASCVLLAGQVSDDWGGIHREVEFSSAEEATRWVLAEVMPLLLGAVDDPAEMAAALVAAGWTDPTPR